MVEPSQKQAKNEMRAKIKSIGEPLFIFNIQYIKICSLFLPIVDLFKNTPQVGSKPIERVGKKDLFEETYEETDTLGEV